MIISDVYVIFVVYLLIKEYVLLLLSYLYVNIHMSCICRYLQTQRGAVPFVICKVEYIPPVMAVYFRPLNKVRIYSLYG